MRSSLKIFFVLLFLSCNNITYKQLMENPDNYELYPDFPLLWDGRYPVNEFVATIKLNEPIKGMDGRTIYVLEKYEMYDDSTFKLRLFLFDEN